MFQKKVTLTKTFSSESEYKHFESVYASAPNAFENSWAKEVEDVTVGEALKNVGEAVAEAVETIGDKLIDLVDGDEKREPGDVGGAIPVETASGFALTEDPAEPTYVSDPAEKTE